MSPSPVDEHDRTASGPRCVVHIGLNKTGTTTVQSWLAQNREALKSLGVLAPNISSPRAQFPVQLHFLGVLPFCLTNHLAPRGRLRRALGLKTLRDQQEFCDACTESFDAEIVEMGAQLDTVVMSSEMLGGWVTTPQQVKSLDDWLAARFTRIEYLVYLRDPSDWVASRFAQNLKHGATISLDDFVDKNCHTNLFRMLNLWSDTLGKDRFHIRLFERDELLEGDIVTDFCGTANIERTGTNAVTHENVSPSARELQITLIFNRLCKHLRIEPKDDSRLKKTFRWFSNGKKLRLSPAQAAKIYTTNAGDLEKIRIKYFPERSGLFAQAQYKHTAGKQE